MRKNYNDLTYEQIEEDIIVKLMIYNSHELKAWNVFKKLYKDIPEKYRIKIIINCIYSYYAFNLGELFEYINDCLDDETLENSQERYNEIIQELQKLNLINEEGLITLYRGYDGKSEDNDIALSWSYDRDDALFFALRRKNFNEIFKTNEKSTPYLIEIKVNPESVLQIMDDDREHEIALTPESDKIIVSDEEVIMSLEEAKEFNCKHKGKQDKAYEDFIKKYLETKPKTVD